MVRIIDAHPADLSDLDAHTRKGYENARLLHQQPEGSAFVSESIQLKPN